MTGSAPDGSEATAARTPNWRAILRLLRRAAKPVQQAAARAIGVDRSARVETVEQMLAFNARRAPGYWIQLSLAAGIALLGLVLGSTAVVIGAMLISPLMGPIVELGMGFAVGSSFLVIRSALRVAISTVVVVAGSALFTVVLPFHEVTSEIAARTSPTALDLLVAVLCALTAAYTTVRRTSDTTSAAAGTAIGIALVPPICVIGYGLGTGDGTIAGGAALLFTANFSAILLFAVLAFLLLGYDEVNAQALEERFFALHETRLDRLAARGEAGLKQAFGSRYGMAARLLIPLLFLAAVYLPLRSALDRVSWEVAARTTVQRLLHQKVPDAVQQSVSIARNGIAVHLVVIGDGATSLALEHELETSLAAATGVTPTVRVLAVPDAAALARAQAVPEAATPTLPPLEQARTRLGAELARVWPVAAAGTLGGWSLEVPAAGPPRVTLLHFGPTLGAAGEALVAAALAPALEATPSVDDVPLDTVPVVAGRDRAEWLRAIGPLLERSRWMTSAIACVRLPVADTTGAVVDSLRRAAARGGGRIVLAPGRDWRAAWSTGRCDADTLAVREP